MDTKNLKEGVSVKEIESFAKKHRLEVFFCLSLILSGLFSFIFFSGWCAILAAVGGILGILFPCKINAFLTKAAGFIVKQEEITQLILGIAGLVLAIFLPIVTFFLLGICGGKALCQLAPESCKEETGKTEEHLE